MRTLICLLLTCLTSFGAGYRIKDLPVKTTLTGNEYLELDDGIKSWCVSGTNLFASLGTNKAITIINISTNINNYSYMTNVWTTNMYAYSETVYSSYITNLYATTEYVTNLYARTEYVTNLYATTEYVTNLYATTEYVTNLYATTNINNYDFTTNLYSTTAYFSTNYSTNLYSTTEYVTNLYATTEYVTNLTAVTNINNYSYSTNLYSTTEVVSNVYATNIYVSYLVASNLLALHSTNNLAGAASNIVVNMDIAGLEVTVTNNITLTNYTGLVAGTTKTRVLFLQVTTGGPWSVTYPSDGASYGLYWATNCLPQANRPYTSLTNGSTYVLSLTSRGTNMYAAMTEWK